MWCTGPRAPCAAAAHEMRLAGVERTTQWHTRDSEAGAYDEAFRRCDALRSRSVLWRCCGASDSSGSGAGHRQPKRQHSRAQSRGRRSRGELSNYGSK
eukprot:6205607-Pleurochrysis_carterae.AAC.4